tara:strand:+ start:10374 stop:11216 length:843 start_codon:yes stop_codon:yes gene_type:complete
MTNKSILPDGVKEVLTEESITSVESAIKDKLSLAVEAALTEQDELYSEKLQELVSAIDKDHTAKLERVVESVDRDNSKKLTQVVNKYEKELHSSAKDFKNVLIESVSDYLEEYLDEAVPQQQILEATQNRTAMEVLTNLRKVLAVDASLMSESVKEAVVDGKTQIDELSKQLNTLQKENAVLKEQYTKTKTTLLIETKTSALPEKKAQYLRKILEDKTPAFIEENFEYTARLFDKKEKERLEVIKEEAYTQRKVKADVPKKQPVEKPVENPYMAELARMK